MLYSRNSHNIINQLYCNMKLSKKKRKERTAGMLRVSEDNGGTTYKNSGKCCFSKLEVSLTGKIPYNQTKFVVYVCGKLEKSIHEKNFLATKKKRSPLIWNWISWISYDLCLYRCCLASISHKKVLEKTQTAMLETFRLCFMHPSASTCYFQAPITMIYALRRQLLQLTTL